MANEKTDKNPLVVVNLDRPRFVRFGHKALKQLSALLDQDLNNLAIDSMDLEEIEKIMFCGLLSDAVENNEILKLEDMENLLDKADSYMELITAMNTALEKAFEQTEKQKN